ncbi:hypothetical protein RGQ15_13620 [Paracoccus sp. MBLB3053]|uniref:Uncharacterized protein n=1 Tax=Paracoccus aurantius TaxID=3073814 RepID=A0ABU2HU71_9RHOB|nr:hypothetical protein [Paracoccus sp. MBLB3053]MDS9468603.1 hypothetical protein [Paracoccus sp. MBLB3053]
MLILKIAAGVSLAAAAALLIASMFQSSSYISPAITAATSGVIALALDRSLFLMKEIRTLLIQVLARTTPHDQMMTEALERDTAVDESSVEYVPIKFWYN